MQCSKCQIELTEKNSKKEYGFTCHDCIMKMQRERRKLKKDGKWEGRKYGGPRLNSRKTAHKIESDVEYKSCSVCKEWKTLDLYGKQKDAWDGLKPRCKLCDNKIINEQIRNKLANDPEFRKKYYEYQVKYKRDNVNVRLANNLRRRLNFTLKGISKSQSTLLLLGCSLEVLLGYLEKQFQPGMTWENYGKWHVDHIKPCCKFDLNDPEEQKKCFHYTNLQPLWAKDNLNKSGRLDWKNNESH
jgi:hypothetical protein